jgi:copper chaperone CopZ
MMTSNELFYGDSEPVWVVDSSPYPRRSRASSYESDRYYSSRPGYYRGNSYSRDADYYTGDRYTDIDGYRGAEYYRSRPGYYEKEYSPDRYYSGSPTSGYGAAYDDTYYDSRPYDYYDYRRPSTVVMNVPICCEGCCEEARNALFELRGVRSVYCDVKRERVTVTGTAAPADILQAMRKLHKKARFWGDEDYY